MKKLAPFFIAFIVQSPLIGQHTANYISNWHFGENVGITFSSGSAVLSTSAINVYEASTGYSDGNGDNLFYVGAPLPSSGGTGFVVWDASHNTMPNGNISVDYSSTCGLTCAPIPGSCDQHYIFHVTSTGSGTGVHYSVADMTLPGNGTAGAPLGDISTTQKDILLYGGDNLAEKLLIVQKGNTENYWVIARSITQDVFYSFEVSAAGINPVPLVSVISPTLWPGPTGSPVFSWVAINKDRNMLAEANGWGGNIVLYDFDNLIGTVTFGDEILSGGIGLDIPYGVAFSPNGNVLYTSWYESSSGNTNLSYFDVSAGYGNIAITRQDFVLTTSGINQSAAVVKAPDNKLYSPLHNFADLSVVDDPDNFLAPNINFLSFSVAPDSSIFGLPNLAYYYHPENFIDTLAGHDITICVNNPVEIGASGYDSIWANYVWEPAAMLSGSPNEASPFTIDLSSDQEYVLHVIHSCGDTIKSDTVLVTVSGLSAGLNSTLDICDDMGPFDLVDFIAGNPDPSGIISPALNSGTSIFDPALDVAGTYTYTHTDSCANSSNTTINLINCEVCAANLVPNPSFESISSCPSVGGQMTAVDDWDNYTGVTGGGSADYFNSCGYSNPSVQANTGNGHIGFFSYIDFIPDAREYAQAQLASPLVAGECYSISMYLALSSSSDYAHDSVGILLTAAPPIGSVGGVIYATPQLATTTSNMVTDSNWVLISGTFVASGGEQFITIGVFTDDANLTLVPTGIMPDPTIIDHSYYMVDDVCVHAATPDTPSIFTPNSWYCVGDNITALTSDIGNAWYDDALLTNQVGIDTSFTPTPVAGTTTYYVIDTTGGCYSLADSVNVTFENCSDPCSTNLFQNGGFESYSACPTGPSEITNATGWLNVQSASNDYFNCTYFGHPSGTTYPGFPNATDGMFYNPEGSGYVGFIAGGTGFGKEGFGQQIELKKCVEYTIQFRMAHNNVSGPPDNDICIYGGNAPTALGCMTGFTSLACIEADSIALNWKLFTLTFTPTQDYSYLAISGACPTTGTSAIGGYVYLDDLFLCEDLCANQATNITPIVISDDFCGTGIGSATVSLITPCFTGFYFDWTLGGISVSTDSISTGLQAGTYDVLVTDSNSCTISTNVVIPDSGSISAPTVSNDTAYCANDTLANLLAQGSGGTINWYSDNNLTAVIGTGDSLSPSISIGTTTYYLNETFMGCTSPIDSVVVSITPAPNVTIVGDTSFCAGDSIILDAGNSGSAYSWLPGGETSQTVFISYSGLQLVIVTDTNGCSNSDSVMVIEASLPIHNGISGSNICLGHLATLISSGLGSLSWSTTETSDSIFVSPATSTTFYSTYTNACGSITDSIVVTVHPNPSTNAYGDTTVAPLENTTIGASGGVSYSWSPAAGLDCSSCADPVASITQTTLFFVVVTDSNGCSDIDSVLVTIDDNTALFVPNVFSPNGDGFNDEVFVRGGAFSEFHFTIYNRWGQVVFETKDRLVGWNGTYRNKELDPAVFVYRLTYTDWQGTEGELSGNITLIK